MLFNYSNIHAKKLGKVTNTSRHLAAVDLLICQTENYGTICQLVKGKDNSESTRQPPEAIDIMFDTMSGNKRKNQ